MKRVVLRLIGVMLALTMCISILPTSVFAWKNLTHVNSADLILLELQRSAKQNGGRASVMVYAPYEDGEGRLNGPGFLSRYSDRTGLYPPL